MAARASRRWSYGLDRRGRGRRGRTDLTAATAMIDRWQTERTRFVPGFGHRFHKPEDPRAPRLLALVDEAAAEGTVSGRFAAIGRAIQTTLNTRKGKPVPMNIDGATAVIYAELGFAGPLARGLFCHLSRSVGQMQLAATRAHAWEQSETRPAQANNGRNKGPEM
jgi:citrate synthase